MTEAPAINGWMSVVEIFNNAKVPFVVTMGNHDAEHMAKDSIYDLLQNLHTMLERRGLEMLWGVVIV